MLSVRGICEDGKVSLLDPIPNLGKRDVIVTILETIRKPKKSRSLDETPSVSSVNLSYSTLDPLRHIRPLKEVFNECEGNDNGVPPFSDIESIEEFSKNLRNAGWRT